MRPMPHVAVLGMSRPICSALILSLCYGCALFQRLAFQSVGPRLDAELGLGAAALADLGASFFWAYLVLMIPCGILVDIQGPRSMAIAGALLSSAGCALFAAARGLPQLMVARVIISAGGAVAFVCMMRFIGTTFPTRKATISGRGILIGNLGAFSAGAPLALVLTRLHWRELWALLAFGWLVLAMALWRWVPAAPADKLGGVRPAAVTAELRSIFGASSTYLGIVLIAGLAGSYLAFANFVGPRVLSLSGRSSIEVGMVISVLVCGYAIGAACWGWLGDRAPRERLIAMACALTGAAWVTFTELGPLSPATATVLLFAAGFGSGAFGLVYLVMTERHQTKQSGLVIACVNCGIPLGAALLQSTAGRLEGFGMMTPILSACIVAMLAAIMLLADGRATLSTFGKACRSGLHWPPARAPGARAATNADSGPGR